MKAELIAVGSELLLFGRRDTNGDWLAERLARLGVPLLRRTIVGDDETEISNAIHAARARCGLVIVSGGLGPTADDVTREALARALGRPLRIDPVLREAIRVKLRGRGIPASRRVDLQASVPEGCEAIENTLGSAPGLLDAGPACWTFALPGVPVEMKAMFEAAVRRLEGILPTQAAPVARLLVTGVSESEVDERLRGLIGVSAAGATVTILATGQGVELHVLGPAGSPDRSAEEVSRIVSEARDRLGEAISGEGDETLADVIGSLLVTHRRRLSVAESCTGGLLGATITRVPGASEWFAGGFLVYSDALKRDLLGIPAEMLDRNGAVSEAVACEMAEGARRRTGTSDSLAITGIAGPGGATADKPVGLVYVAHASGGGTVAVRHHLGPDRQTIRARSVTAALDLLRCDLLGSSP